MDRAWYIAEAVYRGMGKGGGEARLTRTERFREETGGLRRRPVKAARAKSRVRILESLETKLITRLCGEKVLNRKSQSRTRARRPLLIQVAQRGVLNRNHKLNIDNIKVAHVNKMWP